MRFIRRDGTEFEDRDPGGRVAEYLSFDRVGRTGRVVRYRREVRALPRPRFDRILPARPATDAPCLLTEEVFVEAV